MSFKAGSRLQSFGFALQGIYHVARHEPNMRVHLIFAAAAVCGGLWAGLSLEAWRWVGLALALVTSAECLNTAVERACDVADPALNPLIKQSKDAAAGAVLLTAIFAAVIGASVLLDRFGGT